MTMAATKMDGGPESPVTMRPALPGTGSGEEAHRRIANSPQFAAALIGMMAARLVGRCDWQGASPTTCLALRVAA